MNIINYIKSPAYRRQVTRQYLIEKVHERHDAMKRHVFIEDTLVYHKTKWEHKKYINIDGLRICNYTDAIEEYYNELWHRYYVLHRKHLLVKRQG